ncbi:MAG: hypothetical protein KIT22_06650 [Verrucomicrobiae bacterium]|nr:hypothetical protein [Verrucomicrobiae bacterium]
MKATCLLLFGCLTALALSHRARAQTLTQTFDLHPGWNSVWIEVDPPDRDPASVFAGLPLHSVWTWSDRVSATEFIQNPGEAGWNRAQWLSFFAPGSPESIVSNLRAILPQRAYLIRLAGTNSVTWSVPGRPVLRQGSWAPDRFNLRGFPIDPSVPITFRTFFRPSPAHYHPATDRLEPIYRLSPDGRWTPVAPNDPMRRGEAYWVHTRGPSDYVAPFHLELNSGDIADFDATERTVTMTIHNRHALPKSIRIEHSVTNPSHLVWSPPRLPGLTNAPQPLNIHTQQVAPATSLQLVLGVDRSKLSTSLLSVQQSNGSPSEETLLSVADQEGTLFNVGTKTLSAVTAALTGLWLGTASIDNVTPTADSGDTTGSGAVLEPFPLRVLLHVDSTGQVRLLRDVTLIYAATNATSGASDPSSLPRFDTLPARLLTNPALVQQLSPLDLRAGRLAGRRLTAPHFDFAPAAGQHELPLIGTFAPGNQISGVLSLPPDLPTNPFLHRYHPDHGTNRSLAITRSIQLSLGGTNTSAGGVGDVSVSGTYSESIEGLHKGVLTTSGTLSLRRISAVGNLNAP